MQKLVVSALAVFGAHGCHRHGCRPSLYPPGCGPRPTPATVPLIKPECEVAPCGTWTGFYAGGNGDYTWAKFSFTHVEGTATGGESFTNALNKLTGGAQIGARYQVLNSWVLGVEAAFNLRNQEALTRTDLDGFPRYRLSRADHLWALSGNGGFAFGNLSVVTCSALVSNMR